MVEFLGMDPINPIAGNPETVSPKPEFSKSKKGDNQAVTILSVAAFVLLAIGVIIFLYNQNQNLKKQLSGYLTATPVASVNPSSAPAVSVESPTISSPSADSVIKSPLTVTGKVPAGWMFEGVFPIKLLDSEKNVIAQALAKEVTAGSWQSGEPVDFKATLTFKNATGAGSLVLENDNPSGDPRNSKTFEMPVNFQ